MDPSKPDEATAYTNILDNSALVIHACIHVFIDVPVRSSAIGITGLVLGTGQAVNNLVSVPTAVNHRVVYLVIWCLRNH